MGPLAHIFGIGQNAAYQLIKSGTIGHDRIGRDIRIPKLCVVDHLTSARCTVTKQ
ncbi:helix-turn-helix domain-containing protein [uncultured Oscillibacter sp.]|uniref:helix-turn-helix domain-containing protein n=1 Tax=uncultured Oscillibacter sp. TaxID=876091 RepID=UPI0025DD610A|nr:helix-turn-helix domain-containing protein [uncultured Oscillibacter sp.]